MVPIFKPLTKKESLDQYGVAYVYRGQTIWNKLLVKLNLSKSFYKEKVFDPLNMIVIRRDRKE